MYNFVKWALILGMLFLLAGCSKGVSISYSESVYETDMTKVSASLPQFECGANRAFAEEINEEIANMASAFSDELSKKAKERERRAILKITSKETLNDGELVSVLLEGEADTGGAHSEKFRISRTYDFKNARRIYLEDVFEGEEWKKAVDAEMERCTKEEDEYKELWEMPSTKILKPENFYFKNNGKIVFFFPPYELSYYRRGFVEFEFDIERLSGFFKPEMQKVNV